MVTSDRLSMAKRSIQCFVDQTYPRLELVVVCAGNQVYREALERHIEREGVENVRVIGADRGTSLGALRNLSFDAARGEVVCQWDDDDCHHPDRVLRQIEHMTQQGASACFLTDNLHLLAPDGQMFWIDWTRGTSRREQWFRLLPGTVTMVKDDRFRYLETGLHARLGEDLDLAERLCRQTSVATLANMGWLYLYTFHGRNTWTKEHHYAIPARRSFPNEWVEARSAELRRAARYYAIPDGVAMCGSGGRVFDLLTAQPLAGLVGDEHA
jgi:glycosyltransferase involved in cell wall biosynthesis